MSACSTFVCVCPCQSDILKSLCTHAQVLIWAFVCGFEMCLSWCVCKLCTSVRAVVCVCVAAKVYACACVLRSREQSTAGLSVPPDVTLLSSGADPAAEVGRPTAPLLWVGESRRKIWAGWRYGLAPRLHAEH